jgi:hypothetical protein
MSTHTEGPWILGDENNAGCEVQAGPVRISLDRADPFTGAYVISRDEMLANARLVSAAPKLLDAAEAMCAHLENIHNAGAREFAADPVATARYEALHAAIAKARGGR